MILVYVVFRGATGHPATFLFRVLVELPTAGRRMYVDPTNYDSPENAVEQFAKELDPGIIHLQRMIGGGKNASN